MSQIINPEVNVLDYGPKIMLKNGSIISPDEIIRYAALGTYKDISFIDELVEQKKEDPNYFENISQAINNSTGRGHASMTTSIILFAELKGHCSKFVDSMLTGVRFGSSLMPSGRRIPIQKEQIVISEKIHKNSNAENLYIQESEKNIQLYEKLKEKNKNWKQEASKIVQYGLHGGGFMAISLETIVNLSKDIEDNPFMPNEGKQILSQLEEFIFNHGMDKTYMARKNAPRTGCINPNIFHNELNDTHTLMQTNFSDVKENPVLLNLNYFPCKERDKQINAWIKKRDKLSKNPLNALSNYNPLLKNLKSIISNFNNSIEATFITNTPWRVGGEVKRHRTMFQIPESIYKAIDRAKETVKNMDKVDDLEILKKEYLKIFSIPPFIQKDAGLFKEWIERINNSIITYERLIKMKIPESEAIAIIPRGLKLGILKKKDFYNLTLGYDSLRLCQTAEPEMMQITEQERALLLKQDISKPIKNLLIPKCGYVNFCPDRYCKKKIINRFVPRYNRETHDTIHSQINEKIRGQIS